MDFRSRHPDRCASRVMCSPPRVARCDRRKRARYYARRSIGARHPVRQRSLLRAGRLITEVERVADVLRQAAQAAPPAVASQPNTGLGRISVPPTDPRVEGHPIRRLRPAGSAGRMRRRAPALEASLPQADPGSSGGREAAAMPLKSSRLRMPGPQLRVGVGEKGAHATAGSALPPALL